MSARFRLRFVLVVAVLALVAAGCGDDTTDVESGAAGAGGSPTDVVLLVELTGAFTTAETNFQMVPLQAVYADGTVVEPGAQILIYPGPALPALNAYTVTADALAAIEDAAREASLDRDDLDYGQPPVADVGATVVTVVIDGETYVHSATALDMTDGLGPSMTDEQVANREALAGFLAAVRNLAELAGDDAVGEAAPFVPEAYRLWVRPAAEVPVEPGLERDAVEWDVEGVELAESTCLAVEGDAADAATALLTEADALTPFTSGGQDWAVVARPVLPHEAVC